MLATNWTPVYAPGNQPIMYYLNMPTQYAVFDKGSRIVGRQPGIMPLPYTKTALLNRLERGASVPADWSSQVFTIQAVTERALADGADAGVAA